MVRLALLALLSTWALAVKPGFAQQLVSSSTAVVSNQSSPPTASTPSTPPGQDVPVIDAGLGPCSLELQVNDGYAKPVVSADVKVHIAYGFMGVRKMDLEANTNMKGKVKFSGLPEKVRNPPLEFKAAKDQLTGVATYNPATECQAKHDVVLEKLKTPDPSGASPTPTP